jgi:hypothetical protein
VFPFLRGLPEMARAVIVVVPESYQLIDGSQIVGAYFSRMPMRSHPALTRCLALTLSAGLVLACRAPTKQQPISATAPATSVNSSSATRTVVDAQPHADRFASPELDLPADRLHEHVDGAEPSLQALGCRRLLYWHLAKPSVQLEIFVFNTEAGARTALDKDSGSARTNGVPGDEGWANQQVVYFRRGTAYCRLIAEQPVLGSGLFDQAFRVERALKSGEIRP